jgi:hypothetical protein
MSNKWEAIPPPAEILERIYAEEKFKDFDFFGAQMVVENLLIGPITVVTNNKLMKDIGITHVLSIINARPLFPKEFTYKVVDLKDLPSENLIIHLLDCISFIDDCIKQGKHTGNSTAYYTKVKFQLPFQISIWSANELKNSRIIILSIIIT